MCFLSRKKERESKNPTSSILSTILIKTRKNMTGKVYCAHTLTLIGSRALLQKETIHLLPLTAHQFASQNCSSELHKLLDKTKQENAYCRQSSCQHMLSPWTRLDLFLRKCPQNHLVQTSGAQCQLFHQEVPSCHAVLLDVHLAVIPVSVSKTKATVTPLA